MNVWILSIFHTTNKTLTDPVNTDLTTLPYSPIVQTRKMTKGTDEESIGKGNVREIVQESVHSYLGDIRPQL